MTVSPIASQGMSQTIYTFQNTHFNQVKSTPVHPVEKTQRVSSIEDQEDQRKVLALYEDSQGGIVSQSKNSVMRQTDTIRSTYAQEESAQYNQANPYEAARMVTESVALAGMNIDMLA